MAKYSLEFKLKIVMEYLSGTIGYVQLAKKYGFKNKSQIKTWVNAYQTLGIDGLKRSRKNSEYSIEFKLNAITIYETSEKSYQTIANNLGLKNPSLIARWRKEYEQNGIDGLSRKQGRPTLTNNSKKKNQKEIKPNIPIEITDLEAANKRIKELEYDLRMQTIKNEYLELLRSLRQQKAMKTKQESSTNSEKKNTN